MNKVPILKNKIESRLADIKKGLHELERFTMMNKEKFMESPDNYAIAEHYLRRILDAVFDIGNHILSRIPMENGERPTTYKGISLALGKYHIVPHDFSKGQLYEMAGYRHRLVHFYHEVSPAELFDILRNDLKDIELFCSYSTKVLKQPELYSLIVE